MAEDFRTNDPGAGDLAAAKAALVRECAEQSRNSIYTSTQFYICLKWLKGVRAALWVIAAASGTGAASTALSQHDDLELLVAALSLLAVVVPGAIKALKLDDTIAAYEAAAAKFKVAEGELRRAADVWSNKPYDEFEDEARKALASLDSARAASLTPPEWFFRKAQRKVQSGDYDPDKLPER